MKVHLTPAEYELLCRIADYYGTYPAALAHEWIMRQAAQQYTTITARGAVQDGILGTGQAPIQSQGSKPVQAGSATLGSTSEQVGH